MRTLVIFGFNLYYTFLKFITVYTIWAGYIITYRFLSKKIHIRISISIRHPHHRVLDSQCSVLNVLLKKIQSSFLIIGTTLFANIRSSRPEVFLGKGVLKICRKFTGEHPCRSVISIKLLYSFIALQLYWNHSLAWVFSCKYATYFQNTFY